MFHYTQPFAALMWLLMIAGIAVLTVIAAALLSRASDAVTARPATPQQILQARYASGEIDEAELQRRLAMLAAGGQVPR